MSNPNWYDKKSDSAKEETKIPSVPAPVVNRVPEAQPVVIKTELDAYITELMKGQPQDLEQVQVRDFKFGDPSHILNLPVTVEDAFKKRGLSARWINKDKYWIDRAIYKRGWVIANRTLLPELGRENFSANGTIENGDCILGCMPVKQADKLRKMPGDISSERVKNLPVDKHKNYEGSEKIGLYKPAYTASEDKEGHVVRTGIQPDLPDQQIE